ncbi:MAG: PKD domain-containing protein [Mucilaginibacter sp.]
MYKRIIYLLFYSILSSSVHAQSIVQVNHATGTAGLNIPLFNVQNGGVSVPVSMSYSATGVKVKDIEGNAGMNWQLSAGGRITRQVRGLPDDCSKNMSSQPRLGWLYNSNGSAINSFTILNNNGATCVDTTDLNYINANFSGLTDTEPDMFYVNAPGLSCQLVFDNSHAIQVIPYRDYKVNYTTGTDSSITSFTITNDKGIRYMFADTERTIRTTHTASPGTITFFKQDYDQYWGAVGGVIPDHGIKYTSTWNLTQISDPNGNAIDLTYNSGSDDPALSHGEYIYSVDTVNVYVGAASNTFTKLHQYEIRTRTLPHYVTNIDYSNVNASHAALSFVFGTGYSGMPLVTSVSGYGKTVTFSYTGADKKFYLKGFSSASGQCIDPNSYQFDYINLGKNHGADSVANPYTTGIPDSASRQVDYWGYYNASGATSLVPQMYVNPSNSAYERYRPITPTNQTASYPYLLTGTSRSADTTTVLYGTLNKVTYAEGGTTTIAYESSDFYDSTAGVVVQGGGIRVKQITDYDAMTTANNMVRHYSYIDPGTSASSGKPITMPQFAFTTPYTGSGTTLDKWNYSTVRSENNLSPEDNTIVYTYVKETRYGAGSTAYQFLQPATNWDASAAPDWAPTLTYIGRPGCVVDGFMTNDKNTYPFPPNTNFDFERGLLSKVTSYADNGNEVSEAAYSYARSSSPTVITGFKFDTNGTTVGYAKYTVFANTSELDTMVVKKVYDSQSQTYAQQSTENYYYGGTYHNLSRQKTTNSNGIVYNNYIKYTKDYTVSTGTDSTTNAIYHLQQLNINTPVETYSTVTQSGTTLTTAASLIKFKTVDPTGVAYLYLPVQKLNFVSVNGTSSFTPATISGGGVFTYDSNYIPVENDLLYDFAGYPLSVDDNNRHVQTVITDHSSNAPVASISNARADEIAYNDFNSQTAPVNFTKTGYTYSPNARTGQFSLSLPASTAMTHALTKNAQAGKYIFSIWVFSASAGTVTVSLTEGTHTNTDTISYAGNSKWSYHEKKLSLASLSSGITASFQSSTDILIDDIFLYPDVAEVSATAYDPATYQKTAATNTNGVSNYFTYDMFNRPLLTYDQDMNILSKKSYYSNSSLYPGLSSLAVGNTGNYVNTPIAFFVQGLPDCLKDQVTAVWNFGDGSPTVTGTNPSHTYTSTGSKTVSVALASIFFSSQTPTKSITIGSPPSGVAINYSNLLSDPNRGKVSSITFSGTGGYHVTFTEAQLIAGQTIPQDNYTVTFTVSTAHSFTPLWNSLNFNNGTDIGCWSRSSGTSGTMPANLSSSTYLNLTLDTAVCSY